ncbi:phosphatidyl-N-methylethanolamine N-methyltransferase [Diutina catenulata]
MDKAIDFVKDTQYLFTHWAQFVDWTPELQFAVACITFNPVYWNIVARMEYNTHILTKIFQRAKYGCYFLAFTIFTLGIYRDHVYNEALANQPTYYPYLENPVVTALALATFGWGSILVVSSMWALGVTGTYLGDYFGILMEERVTGFPFNVNDNPMYNGSTLCFLGTALWYGKPAGILVAAYVFVMYRVALAFEEPFTAKIYALKAEREAKKAQ